MWISDKYLLLSSEEDEVVAIKKCVIVVRRGEYKNDKLS